MPAWEFRARRWAAAETSTTGWAIKGNVTQIRMTLDKGKRWFCTEAVAAGWRSRGALRIPGRLPRRLPGALRWKRGETAHPLQRLMTFRQETAINAQGAQVPLQTEGLLATPEGQALKGKPVRDGEGAFWSSTPRRARSPLTWLTELAVAPRQPQSR